VESKLQKKIIKNLELNGWFVVKLVLTNKSGIPDIICCKNKRVVWIECKDKGKKEEPLQLHRHKELRTQGFLVFTIDSWEEYLLVKHLHFKK
jgi:Holliday junction resolvase